MPLAEIDLCLSAEEWFVASFRCLSERNMPLFAYAGRNGSRGGMVYSRSARLSE